jgi:hypothetical protein
MTITTTTVPPEVSKKGVEATGRGDVRVVGSVAIFLGLSGLGAC